MRLPIDSGMTPVEKTRVSPKSVWADFRGGYFQIYFASTYSLDFTPGDITGDGVVNGINPNSLSIIEDARVESSLSKASGGDIYQFEREGYFVVDTVEYDAGKLVFNRAVSLRDTWARVQRNRE